MKRTAWIISIAIAAVGIVYLAADMFGNGMLRDFLSEQFFYMDEYTDTTGILHQYLSPNWYRIKQLLFLLTALTAVICIVCVRTQSNRIAMRYKAELEKAMETALHQFLEDRDFYLPEGFGNIEALLLQIRAKEQKQLALLEKQTRQKHDLISYLAHDMKTPLASVIGYLNLLNDVKDIPAAQRDAYIRITLDKADRLEQLIDEFFDITRFNLHDIVISRGKIALDFLLEQLKEQFYPTLLAQHKELQLEIAEGSICYGDADKLARAFNNVLKNAISYSYPDTVIRVAVKQEEQHILLEFHNQGDEIPAQKLEMIFEKFFRLDQARSTASGGAGLGLAIAKEIIEAHGGSIYADSNVQETVFYIKLPMPAKDTELQIPSADVT
ncbi:HAMP domain-containing histidine kinase [[Clostridium] innocuum]|nr:HAMP domain-containing histidine kinase [[Clostridium] innocuum]MCR0575729.1 HAMP domain-containing histidine kinase [[Clostridium] innocuum]